MLAIVVDSVNRVGQKRTIKFVRKYLNKTMAKNAKTVKFGNVLAATFLKKFAKITQIHGQSQTLLAFLSCILSDVTSGFKSLSCHDFQLLLRMGETCVFIKPSTN